MPYTTLRGTGFTKRLIRYAVALPVSLALAIAAAGCGGDGAGGSATTTVRFGSVGGLSDAPIFLAKEYGYFKEAGIEVTESRMSGAPDLTVALASGNLDVAGIATSAGMYNAVRDGVGMVIVGDKKSIDAKYSDNRLVVRKDLVVEGDPTATVKNLVGKRVAVTSRTSSAYKVLVDLANHYGVDVKQIKAVELGYGDMAPAFTNGAIEAATVIEPFLTRMVDKDKTLVVVADAVPESTLGELPEGVDRSLVVPLVYSEAFAGKREVAERFMVAYMRGVRLYYDALGGGKDKDRVYDIIAKKAQLPRDLVESAYLPAYDVDQKISLVFFEDLQDWFIEIGALKERIDVSKMIDTSFAEAAIKQLGPYEKK